MRRQQLIRPTKLHIIICSEYGVKNLEIAKILLKNKHIACFQKYINEFVTLRINITVYLSIKEDDSSC